MKLLPTFFPKRHEHRTLAAMLGLLHIVIWWDFGSGTSRSLMLAHIGLFLLWQPLLSPQRKLNWRSLAAFATVALAFISALSWLLLGFWLLILIGLVGGRINLPRRQRYAYLAALVHLALEFLVGWVPRMFSFDAPPSDFMELFRYGLFLTPAVVFFIRTEEETEQSVDLPTIDFIYGLTMSILSVLVALGSLVTTFSAGTDYPVALIQSVMAIAIFLLTVAWLWGPMAGFSGLGQLWERYVQNAGTPFELWLNDLQHAARASQSPEQFLDQALVRLFSLRWVVGLAWHVGVREGKMGDTDSENTFRSRSGELRITIHSHRRMGTALMLHARLLIQLIGHFYSAKQSEREIARQAHVRAIYETGARMTHDIKNLLQGLSAMTSAVEHAQHRDPDAARELVRRQLPLITQRLQLSLDKLQAPEIRDAATQSVNQWWQTLTMRNEGHGIEFISDMDGDAQVPVELFDTVAENLIENARYKRQLQPHIQITVRLAGDSDTIALRVSDNGSAVPAHIKQSLFVGAIDSDSGLGIGLYQAAKLAQDHGYRLQLLEDDGQVVFELRSLGAQDHAEATTSR